MLLSVDLFVHSQTFAELPLHPTRALCPEATQQFEELKDKASANLEEFKGKATGALFALGGGWCACTCFFGGGLG